MHLQTGHHDVRELREDTESEAKEMNQVVLSGSSTFFLDFLGFFMFFSTDFWGHLKFSSVF